MTDQLKEIGTRLSVLRDICGLTAEEMAAQLGISAEEYAAYENGEADFSFSTLYNCAVILGIDILDLMSGDSPKLSTCAYVKAGKGFSVKRYKAYDYKHLAFTFRNKKAEPFLVTVEPTDKPITMNSHDGQEFNYVLSGKVLFSIGDIAYELEAGDSVYFDSSVPHCEKAIDGKAQFIAVVMK